MGVRQPRYSKEEFAQRGQAIYEKQVRLGEEHDVAAIIDTGFTGHLTLPMALIDRLALPWLSRAQALLADGSLHVFDAYVGTVLWNGQDRTVEVDAADTDPLAGMGLLRGHRLSVDVVENGAVKIEALA